MANATVTKTGDVIETLANDLSLKYSKISENVVTGYWVGLLADGSGVHSNLKSIEKVFTNSSKVDTISAVTTDTNTKVYDQLKALI